MKNLKKTSFQQTRSKYAAFIKQSGPNISGIPWGATEASPSGPACVGRWYMYIYIYQQSKRPLRKKWIVANFPDRFYPFLSQTLFIWFEESWKPNELSVVIRIQEASFPKWPTETSVKLCYRIQLPVCICWSMANTKHGELEFFWRTPETGHQFMHARSVGALQYMCVMENGSGTFHWTTVSKKLGPLTGTVVKILQYRK